ncbi:MAG: peptidoglycan-associated lipoprotein [Desulfobacterales bacterium]|nr:MAG: peptidoglycan-associated lipoprotein [Desulfobacterales bacterium]
MRKNMWMKLMMAVLMAAVMGVISCADKKVVTEPEATVNTNDQDQAADAAAAAEAAAAKAAAEKARLEAERIQAQALEAQRAQEQAARAAAKNKFVNQNVLFDYDSAELSPLAKMLLKEKAEWLSANPSVSIIIQGHCDKRGTTEYNLALGERRALAAKNYLQDLGVYADRMKTISYGEEYPLDPANTPEAYQKNRRAQFVIQSLLLLKN